MKILGEADLCDTIKELIDRLNFSQPNAVGTARMSGKSYGADISILLFKANSKSYILLLLFSICAL